MLMNANQKLPSPTTHCCLTPPSRGTPANVCIHLIFLEAKIIGLGGLRKTFFLQQCVSAAQGHPRSVIFWN